MVIKEKFRIFADLHALAGHKKVIMHMFIDSLKNGKYLQATIVLALDVVMSLIASLGVLLCYDILSHRTITTAFLASWICGSFCASAIAFYFTRIYRSIIRYSTLRELGLLCCAVLFKDVLFGTVVFVARPDTIDVSTCFIMLLLDVAATICVLVLLRVLMVAVWQMIVNRLNKQSAVTTTLIYGAGEKSAALLTRLKKSTHYKVVGFICYSEGGKKNTLMGMPILNFKSAADVVAIKQNLNIDGVLFAYHKHAREEQNRLIEYCRLAGLKTLIAPTIDEIPDGKPLSNSIRKIRIADLLGRQEIAVSLDEIRAEMEGKTVLVTGAAGSIGSELCRQLATLGVGHLVMLDNAETPLHNVRLEFEDNYPQLQFTPVIGDVRSVARLDFVFRHYRPQIVFHAAAYKHVPLMEENPCEAVLVNVVGSRNVADKCIEHGVEKMVMISTDKAVNPTNIMGCTKRLAEIYVQSLGLAIESGEVKGSTRFVTTRFGNVLGSNGSVIPRFTEQIEKGGPITVTDPEIRRFFMTIPEACRLVMEAATMATGTQIFVFDMGTPIKIADLAKRMIHLAGYEVDKDIRIEYTGLRPGEKLYEEVLATKENTIPTDHERIFVAKVRHYAHSSAHDITGRLEQLAQSVDIPEMVILMKRTVPEFKSKHSEFERYDITDEISDGDIFEDKNP